MVGLSVTSVLFAVVLAVAITSVVGLRSKQLRLAPLPARMTQPVHWMLDYLGPGLLAGATDSRHYEDIAESVFRFIPTRLTRGDLP